jgi:hypothetical protein
MSKMNKKPFNKFAAFEESSDDEENGTSPLPSSDDEGEWTTVAPRRATSPPPPPPPPVKTKEPEEDAWTAVSSKPPQTSRFAALAAPVKPASEHLGSMSGISHDTPIPTGSWTCYYHEPNSVQPKWSTLDSFEKIGTARTFGEMWAIFNALADARPDGTFEDKILANGYFFMMCDPHPPMWEDSKNINGGTYSLKVLKSHAPTVYINYCMAAMLGQVAKDPSNKITGICINSKKDHNIISIWNEKESKYVTPKSDIGLFTHMVTYDLIRYTPLNQKNFTF